MGGPRPRVTPGVRSRRESVAIRRQAENVGDAASVVILRRRGDTLRSNQRLDSPVRRTLAVAAARVEKRSKLPMSDTSGNRLKHEFNKPFLFSTFHRGRH